MAGQVSRHFDRGSHARTCFTLPRKTDRLPEKTINGSNGVKIRSHKRKHWARLDASQIRSLYATNQK